MESIFAVVIGAFLAGFGRLCYDSYRFKNERKQVHNAFRGEISALMSIVDERKYVDGLKANIQNMKQSNNFYFFCVSVKQNYFTVYDTFSCKLSILKGELPLLIAEFYINSKAILEDFDMYNEYAKTTYTKIDKNNYEAQFKWYIESQENLIKLFEKQATIANKIMNYKQ